MAATKHVLVVEDEKPLAHALELKLTHEGMTVTVVDNGEDCMEQLKHGGIDVMLLDLMMPVMDGFQVLEEMQKLPHKPVVYALSNLSIHEDQQRVLGLGATKYFVKADTSLAEIVDEIKQVK